MAGHTYWQIVITVGSSGTNIGVAELQMYDGLGNYLCTGGTPFATGYNTVFGTGAPADAFDGSLSSFWNYNTIFSSPPCLGYQFAIAVDVATIRVAGADSGGFDSPPLQWKTQYSDDGSTWYDATGYITPLSWSNCNAWAYTVDTPPGGYFVNWRCLVSSTNGGGSYGPEVAEIGMKIVSGGAKVTGSDVYAVSDGGAFVHPTLAFDGNSATFAGATSGTDFSWIGYAFQQPFRIIEIDWTTVNTSDYSTSSAVDIALQGSDDAGATWTTVANFVAAPWTIGETQIFGVVPDQRDNIAYNQVRVTDRQGSGIQFQMFGGGGAPFNHAVAYDSSGNTVDGGGLVVTRVGVPASRTSLGQPGQFAIDGSGYLYVCFAINAWMKFTGATF